MDLGDKQPIRIDVGDSQPIILDLKYQAANQCRGQSVNQKGFRGQVTNQEMFRG